MNYGLYLSAAGVLTNLHRQDVLANNLANVNTVGFKPDEVYTRQRLPQRLEAATPIDANRLLEQLGGGPALGGINSSFINLRQGNMQETGNQLDLAIEGEGFFAVRGGTDGDGDGVRLTRDGRFTLSAKGELVLAATGMPLLDINDQSIRLERDAAVTVRSTGEIVQNDQVLATLQITTPRNIGELIKVGDNLLRINSTGATERQPAGGRLLQGHVESSAVDPILALNALIGAAKTAQGNAKMMQYHDHLMGQAINTLGRVA